MDIIKKVVSLDKIRSKSNSTDYGTITQPYLYFNIHLTQNIDEIGIYNDTSFIQNTGNVINNVDGENKFILRGRNYGDVSDYYSSENSYYVTGTTDSKINELQCYRGSLYKESFDITKENGVDYSGNTVTFVDRVIKINDSGETIDNIDYVFGGDKQILDNGATIDRNGIFYNDNNINEITSFKYNVHSLNQTNTSLNAITKLDYLLGIIETPRVENNIEIDRGIVQCTYRHLVMGEIKNIEDLTSFGNNFFNIT